MTARRKRFGAVLAIVAIAMSACGRLGQDEQELRGFLAGSEREPHTFTYNEAAVDRWFSLRGAIEDDLRFRFTISSAKGDLADVVIYDDALAVRLLRPDLLGPYLTSFGHPTTVEALRSGRWVVDPAGAPPLAAPRAADATSREPPDPLDVGVRIFRVVGAEVASARQVREFSLEDIEYRSALDPWRYPKEESGEVRFDLLRPVLPTREDQLQGGTITIGEAQFRKTSMFVQQGKITQICELVDVEGHEEFIKLQERNQRNEFLDGLKAQILEGRAETPVRPRNVYVELAYPEGISVGMPANAVRARLDSFLTGLRGAFKAGLLSPLGGTIRTDCLRASQPAPSATPSP